MKTIDLRRDTITLPTEGMVQAAFAAELGDSVYNEDPQQVHLEKLAAELTGKDAALFLPSGTMGNLVAVLAHTSRGDEIILEENAHIFTSESGGAATVGGLSLQRVSGADGMPDPSDIQKAIRREDIHYPRSSLICLETSHYRYGGTVASLAKMREIRKLSLSTRIPIHLDGARLFNAVCYLDVDVEAITENVDSVMFCLSKGLGAPVGSMLCGSDDFIDEAKRYRKMVGGGMRQTGWLCACGIEALSKENTARLADDHAHAKILGKELNRATEVNVNLSQVHTNFVVAHINAPVEAIQDLPARLAQRGILIQEPKEDTLVLVVSREVDETDVRFAAENILAYLHASI